MVLRSALLSIFLLYTSCANAGQSEQIITAGMTQIYDRETLCQFTCLVGRDKITYKRRNMLSCSTDIVTFQPSTGKYTACTNTPIENSNGVMSVKVKNPKALYNTIKDQYNKILTDKLAQHQKPKQY